MENSIKNFSALLNFCSVFIKIHTRYPVALVTEILLCKDENSELPLNVSKNQLHKRNVRSVIVRQKVLSVVS